MTLPDPDDKAQLAKKSVPPEKDEAEVRPPPQSETSETDKTQTTYLMLFGE